MPTERLTLSYDMARELFDYRDGALYWLTKHNAGKRAGTINSTGRRQVQIGGSFYKEHRIIFLWHHGFMPHEIDHIDGNPLNNTIENLRAATHSQNGANVKRRSDNTSGEKGVHWLQSRSRYVIYTYKDGKRIYGTPAYTKDFDVAVAAVRELRARIHGEFANH